MKNYKPPNTDWQTADIATLIVIGSVAGLLVLIWVIGHVVERIVQ